MKRFVEALVMTEMVAVVVAMGIAGLCGTTADAKVRCTRR
jgi:hypothetical protein